MTHIDKIKKLFGLSKSPNEHEAAAALAKALELCAKTGVDPAALANDDADGIIRLEIMPARSKIAEWQLLLSNQVAEIFSCRALRTTDFFGQRYKIVAIGYRRDAEMVDYFFNTLCNVATKCATEHLKTKTFRKRKTRDAYRNDYLRGAAYCLMARAEKMLQRHRDETGDATGSELVLARRDAVDRYVDNLSTRTIKPKKTTVNAAVHSGYNDAKHAPISRGVTVKRKEIGS